MKLTKRFFYSLHLMLLMQGFVLLCSFKVKAQNKVESKVLVYNYKFVIPEKTNVNSSDMIAALKILPEVTDAKVYTKLEQKQGQCIITINRVLKGEGATYFSIIDVKAIIEKAGLTPLSLTEYEK